MNENRVASARRRLSNKPGAVLRFYLAKQAPATRKHTRVVRRSSHAHASQVLFGIYMSDYYDWLRSRPASGSPCPLSKN